MDICKACGQALGSNQECEPCLKHLIERGTESMDEEKARNALTRAEDWVESKGKGAPQILLHRVQLLIGMARDYFNKTYTEIPWTTVAAVAFAVLYVANPFDLIPDFIPFAGYVDDIMVVGLVIAAIRTDLRKYCAFKGYDPKDYAF